MATYFKSGAHSLNTVNGFSAGMNIKKLDEFAEKIGFNVKQIRNKIKDTNNLQKQLDAAWQGQARDNFVSDLNKAVEKLDREIVLEYADFMSRLQDLANNMYKEDKSLYK